MTDITNHRSTRRQAAATIVDTNRKVLLGASTFEEKVWPTLAKRIPAFERIKVTSHWAGHYSHNTVDHNLIIGPHTEVGNFIFANGFSGHGLQQSPATGRGVSEPIAYRTLGLTPLSYQRIVNNEPFIETAII